MSSPGAPSWFGDRAVLVALEAPGARLAVTEELRALLADRQVRAGMASVLIEAVEPDPGLLDEVRQALARVGNAESRPRTPRTVHIPVHYSGDDLGEVARALDCGIDAVAAAHRAQEWVVAMMGFAPGFGYLEPTGAPTAPWAAVARRDRPRAQVPAGSVALAVGMSAVYPVAMPGGWQVIGRTRARLFDAERPESPTALLAGDRVRFVEQST